MISGVKMPEKNYVRMNLGWGCELQAAHASKQRPRQQQCMLLAPQGRMLAKQSRSGCLCAAHRCQAAAAGLAR